VYPLQITELNSEVERVKAEQKRYVISPLDMMIPPTKLLIRIPVPENASETISES